MNLHHAIRTANRLVHANGLPLPQNDAIVYLGGLVSGDGRIDSELSRRIGMASAEFGKLRQVWSHSNVTRERKLLFLQSCVISKLAYGLGTAALVKVQQRRLDGFHARCLRRILGIPAAYVSRISNVDVFRRSNAVPVSEQVMQRQLMLLRRVGRSDGGSLLRRNTLTGGSAKPVVGSFVRRVGRPRLDWTTQVLEVASLRAGGRFRMELALLDNSVGADQRWTRTMKRQSP